MCKMEYRAYRTVYIKYKNTQNNVNKEKLSADYSHCLLTIKQTGSAIVA
jgi:hypothetical protein